VCLIERANEEELMAPYPKNLIEESGVEIPPIGLYDAPDPAAFEPLVRPAQGKWACVFMFYKRWLKGETLHLTRDNYGCGGAGTYLFGVRTRSREEYIEFLVGQEGLKAEGELMGQWIDQTRPYRPEHPHVLMGPLRDEQYDYLKTVTFFVNPDQLSLFVTGAYYRAGPSDPPVVTAPFASGCGLMAALFGDLDRPRAIIGATDIAMRRFLPPEILAFTVTKPMYEQLCALDEHSFLGKPFWQEVKKARGMGGKS
jgi:hypothetical protein